MKGKVKFECLGEDGLLILIRILNRCVVKFCTEFLVRNGPVNMTMDRLMIQNEVMSSGLLFFLSIWCFRREVGENCALLPYYASYRGDSLPTFRENL